MYLLSHPGWYGGWRDIGLNMAPLAKPTISPPLLAIIQLKTMTKIKTSLYVRKEKTFA